MKKIILLSVLLIGLTSIGFSQTKHGVRINASCVKGGIAKFHVENGAVVLAYFTGKYKGRRGRLGSEIFNCRNPIGCTFTHILSPKLNSKGMELSRHFIRVRGKNEKVSSHSAGCR